MKRTLILSLIIILTKIISFSSNTSILINPDSTVLVQVSDIKYANLIFVEHNKLLLENTLLYEQLDNYKSLNVQLEQINNIKSIQIDELNKNYNYQLEALNKEIKGKNNTIKYWKVGGITVSVCLVIFLILK